SELDDLEIKFCCIRVKLHDLEIQKSRFRRVTVESDHKPAFPRSVKQSPGLERRCGLSGDFARGVHEQEVLEVFRWKQRRREKILDAGDLVIEDQRFKSLIVEKLRSPRQGRRSSE